MSAEAKGISEAKNALGAAADLIECKGWTQGQMARDSLGGSVHVESDTATCFCAAGAILKVCDDKRRYRRAIIRFSDHLEFVGVGCSTGREGDFAHCEEVVTRWNDSLDAIAIGSRGVVRRLREAAET